MDRKEAFSKGATFYTDLHGCKRGHVPAQRYVSTGACTACLKSSRSYQGLMQCKVPPKMMLTFLNLCDSLGVEVKNAQHLRLTADLEPGERMGADGQVRDANGKVTRYTL